MNWRAVVCLGATCCWATAVCAQPPELPMPDAATPTTPGPVLEGPPEAASPSVAPVAAPYVPPCPTPGTDHPPLPSATPYDPPYTQPLTDRPPLIGEPPWCESPYRHSNWRLEIGVVPTESQVSEMAFGDWHNGGSAALNLGIGYESPEGVGLRVKFWGFADNDIRTFSGDVELGAARLDIDFYKRIYIENAELVVGGGTESASLEYRFPDAHTHADFTGGGVTAFGEAWYPLARWRKTDLGSVARARVSVLSGDWNNHGTSFIDDTSHDMMTILDLGWGLQLRRRFGVVEDKYWYVEIVPEVQRWESASLPDLADPGFTGTEINFGIAW